MLLFVKLALRIDSFVEAGPTTDAKIHICHFDDENERCSVSRRLRHFRNLSVITPRYTTTSIMKDIKKADRLISKNAVPLSQSGSKSALHRFV